MIGRKILEGFIILPTKVLQGLIYYDNHQIFDIQEKTHIKNRVYIFPGFIDIHTHGAKGFDVMDGNPDSVLEFAKAKASEGVTQIVPTTLTAPKDTIIKSLRAISRAMTIQRNSVQAIGAQISGIHLEGPFVTKSHYRGAQNPDFILDPNINDFLDFYNAADGHIKIVTLAPEKNGALELIEYIHQKNINVSLGHSEARSEQVASGIKAGIIAATHIFNGMKEFNHYNIGCVGSVLLHDDIFCEIIGDGKHVVVDALELLFRCKPKNKIMFITDSMYCSGLAEGEYEVAGIPVLLKNNEIRTKAGGMAGSIATMDTIVHLLTDNFTQKKKDNMYVRCELTLSHIANMLSCNQAAYLKIEKTGKIKKGYRPNFTIFDQNFQLIKTIVMGQTVYTKE